MAGHLSTIRAKLSIHARRKVRGLLDGEYAAVTTGRSMDFNDLREYVRGDDVKDLDWKATARAGVPLIKRYVAIRKHTVLLVVSTGRSMAAMNDLAHRKSSLAILTAGVLGQLAIAHGDRVALVHGDAASQHQLPPASGAVDLERCLTAIDAATTPGSAPSDLPALLRHVVRTVRRRTIMILVSDEPTLSAEVEELLARLVVQHEVLVATIGDLAPTDPGLAGRDVVDIGTGRALPGYVRADQTLRAEYADVLTDAAEQRRRVLVRLGIVEEPVHDDDSAIRAIFRLLERHRHVRHR